MELLPEMAAQAIGQGVARNQMAQNPAWNEDLNPVIGALQRGHYLLYCQHIVPLKEHAGEAPPTRLFHEILVRLFEEERRLLPPGMFFPMLQEQGLMSLLDCWVVSQVLKLQSSALTSRPGWNPPRNSINLGEDSVLDPEFATFVANQLDKWRPSAETICFEVLSAVVTDEIDAFEELVAALAPRGCGFALGGCSGSAEELELIDRLPLRFVKIDGSLVRKVLISPAHQARLVMIQKRCAARGIETIAEFVEDIETRAVLTSLGVDYAQGFGIAAPVPFLAEI
jgi:EAL domain-containing protein (putative c-di-GMP-specific phosphodiesterase class I)